MICKIVVLVSQTTYENHRGSLRLEDIQHNDLAIQPSLNSCPSYYSIKCSWWRCLKTRAQTVYLAGDSTMAKANGVATGTKVEESSQCNLLDSINT